jgi:hypothetical protein
MPVAASRVPASDFAAAPPPPVPDVAPPVPVFALPPEPVVGDFDASSNDASEPPLVPLLLEHAARAAQVMHDSKVVHRLTVSM